MGLQGLREVRDCSLCRWADGKETHPVGDAGSTPRTGGGGRGQEWGGAPEPREGPEPWETGFGQERGPPHRVRKGKTQACQVSRTLAGTLPASLFISVQRLFPGVAEVSSLQRRVRGVGGEGGQGNRICWWGELLSEGGVSEGGELGGRREPNEGKRLGEVINWKGAGRSHLFV